MRQVFEGSVTTLPNLLSTGGQEFHLGVPAEVQNEFRKMFRSWGSLLWMVALGISGDEGRSSDDGGSEIVKVSGGRG